MSIVHDQFSAADVSAIAKLPYPVVHEWASSGFLTPSLEDARGRGSARLYHFGDLLAARVAGSLRMAGRREHLAFVIRELRQLCDSPARAEMLWGTPEGPVDLSYDPLVVVGMDGTSCVVSSNLAEVLEKMGGAALIVHVRTAVRAAAEAAVSRRRDTSTKFVGWAPANRARKNRRETGEVRAARVAASSSGPEARPKRRRAKGEEEK